MAQETKKARWNRLAVVGLGAMGSAVAAQAKARGLVAEVVGVDRHEAHVEMARRLGWIDRGTTELGPGVIGAQVLVLAVPLDEIYKVMSAIGPDVRPGAVLTCTAGTTGRLREQMVRHVRSAENLVPAFPLVYNQRRGPAGAEPDYLAGARVLLAESPATAARALEVAEELWRGLGLEPSRLPSDDFESAVAGHYFWPLMLRAMAERVAGRSGWPKGASALQAWFDALEPGWQAGRSSQIYAARLSALLGETAEEIAGALRQLGASAPPPADDSIPPQAAEPR